jgi:hypothetical protein
MSHLLRAALRDSGGELPEDEVRPSYNQCNRTVLLTP